MGKNKSSETRKRRVIIATFLRKGGDTSTSVIRNKLTEYNISASRQTVITDKAYLANKDLNQYIRDEMGLLLEVDKDAINAEIKLNEGLREEAETVDLKIKLGGLLRKLYSDRANIDDKIDALRMKKLEIEKPIINLTIGVQQKVDVEKMKKEREKK